MMTGMTMMLVSVLTSVFLLAVWYFQPLATGTVDHPMLKGIHDAVEAAWKDEKEYAVRKLCIPAKCKGLHVKYAQGPNPCTYAIMSSLYSCITHKYIRTAPGRCARSRMLFIKPPTLKGVVQKLPDQKNSCDY